MVQVRFAKEVAQFIKQFNEHAKGYTLDGIIDLINKAADEMEYGHNGYTRTMGYIVTAYEDSNGNTAYIAGFDASLFCDKLDA